MNPAWYGRAAHLVVSMEKTSRDGVRLIKIDDGLTLSLLMYRRRAEFPPDAFWAIMRAMELHTVPEARGILRTASVLWRAEARRTGDRALARAARAALDVAECRQVVTAGEDL